MTKFLLLLLALAVPAVAQITSYEVAGDVVVPGNNQQFAETVHFDFEIQYSSDSHATGFLVRLAPFPVLESSGPLGQFFQIVGPFAVGSGNCGYIALLSTDGDELQVNMCGVFQPDSPPLDFFSATLYACGTKRCVNDFLPRNLVPRNYSLPARNLYLFATLTNVIIRKIQ